MIRTILVRVAYDGRNFIGWQRQEKGRTVQAHLEDALRALYLDKTLVIHGSGRTDKGVHALGQTFHFEAEDKVPIHKLVYLINRLTDDDVQALSCEYREDGFHARFDVKHKTYVYKVINKKQKDPFKAPYYHYDPRPVDLQAMMLAAEHLIGTHDFATFQATGSNVKTSVRTMEEIVIDRHGEEITLSFTANGFLYHMVRILVATLLNVGAGVLSAEDMPGILASKDRERARFTAPAEGLYLQSVSYEKG